MDKGPDHDIQRQGTVTSGCAATEIKMNASLWSIWNTTAQPALAGLKAGEWALLLVLAASLVVVSALRQRYPLIWTAGWAPLVTSRLAGVHGAAMGIPEPYVPAVVQAAFVVAIGLFAGAILVYIRYGICWCRWL